MPQFSITENHLECRYEDKIWKGPSIIPGKDYFRYGERLLNSLNKHSQLIVQIDTVKGLENSFGIMADKSIRCALWLKKQGIHPGDVIGLICDVHINAIIPILSTIFLGAIFTPLWHQMEKDVLLEVLNLTQMKIIFVNGNRVKSIKSVIDEADLKIKLISFDEIEGPELFNDILTMQDPEEVANFGCTEITSPDQPAVICYTLGSNDDCVKGALHSYGNLADNLVFACNEIILEKTTGLITYGFDWISGVSYFLRAICLGCKLILFTESFDEQYFGLIEKYKATWVAMPVVGANVMMKIPAVHQMDFSSVKLIQYGGLAFKHEVFQAMKKCFPNAQIHYSYACTEMAGKVAQTRGDFPLNSCGKVVKNVELKVISTNDYSVLGPNEEGEFYIRSPNLMLRYYNNPEATAAVIDPEGWYHTGDYGYYNDSGDIFITGKVRGLIKYGYNHVSSVQVENAIKEHPGVLEVAVVAKPDEEYIEVPMAFILKKPGVTVTEEEIMEIIKPRESSRFNIKGGLKFVEKLPRTAFGGIDKLLLRKMARSL